MNITTANNPISEVFHFDGYKQIRTMFRPEDDTVLFCGKDVAEALGYKKPENALAAHVDDEDKVVCRIGLTLIQGGTPNMTFITESGVYSLIFKSRLKTAKQFKRWVTSEVLPSIRRSGMYSKAVAESNLKPELQHALAVHIEGQTRRMLDELDRMDYFGTASDAAKKTIREVVAKRFNVPESLITELQRKGLAGMVK